MAPPTLYSKFIDKGGRLDTIAKVFPLVVSVEVEAECLSVLNSLFSIHFSWTSLRTACE
jgi:hypothetical protein